MIFRSVTQNDADDFFKMLCRLDEETDYMMYEPGERRLRAKDSARLRSNIDAGTKGGDLMLCALNDSEKIVGFLWADRGKLNRVLHTAYIVVGVLRDYRNCGIGNAFFDRLDVWARECSVTRLELTVECENSVAVSLYEKHGFIKEGIRRGSMKLNGRYVDEFYMGKIIDESSV